MRPQGFLKMKKKKRENAHSEDIFWPTPTEVEREGEKERDGERERESFYPISPREEEGGGGVGGKWALVFVVRERKKTNIMSVCPPSPCPHSIWGRVSWSNGFFSQ